jgi:hypothetical protein
MWKDRELLDLLDIEHPDLPSDYGWTAVPWDQVGQWWGAIHAKAQSERTAAKLFTKTGGNG